MEITELLERMNRREVFKYKGDIVHTFAHSGTPLDEHLKKIYDLYGFTENIKIWDAQKESDYAEEIAIGDVRKGSEILKGKTYIGWAENTCAYVYILK